MKNDTDKAQAMARVIIEGMDIDDLVAYAESQMAEYYMNCDPDEFATAFTDLQIEEE